MRSLAEQNLPPREPSLVRVKRVPPGGRTHVVCLSDCLWGCWTHWMGNRTEACFCSEPERSIWPEVYKHRWHGYLHVVGASDQQFFLELSADAANLLLTILKRKEDMRGMKLSLWRDPDHKRGAIRLEVTGRYSGIVPLIPEKHPRGMLERLWKCKLPSGQGAA